MAVRATKTGVRNIIQTSLEDSEIDALIPYANNIVNETLGNKALSETLLTDIETWLTAHLIAIGKERQALSEKVGDVAVEYQRTSGKGFLETTTYGQMVLFLDPTGSMQKSSLKKASVIAIKQNNDAMGTANY